MQSNAGLLPDSKIRQEPPWIAFHVVFSNHSATIHSLDFRVTTWLPDPWERTARFGLFEAR